MSWVLEVVLAVVVLGPIALFFVLVALAALAPPPPMLARAALDCPFSHRRVNLALVATPGSETPTDVASCSAFADPERVTCKKQCLELAHAAWAPSPMTPRFALLSGGEAYR